MKVLYFAWIKSKTGTAAEDVTPPDGVTDVAGLVGWLKGRSPGHGDAFANLEVVQVAVNHEFAPFDHPVGPGDEVAFFPPMTGG